jgi:hypothetical protein
MIDGMLSPGEAPAPWGFTPDRFSKDSYLWKDGSRIIISFIEAKQKGKGHFSPLVKAVRADGFSVDVPTPLREMKAILKRWDWKPRYVEDVQMGPVEVWSHDS